MAGRFPPRIFRRVPFEAEIRIRFEDAPGEGAEPAAGGFASGGGEIVARTANVSLGGMFVLSPEPPPVGTAFELEFKLPEQPAPVRGRGRVVWTRTEGSEEAPPGMGVRFLELTPGSRELIFQVVERRVRDGGSPYDEGSQESGSIADRLAAEPDDGEEEARAPAAAEAAPPPALGSAAETSFAEIPTTATDAPSRSAADAAAEWDVTADETADAPHPLPAGAALTSPPAGTAEAPPPDPPDPTDLADPGPPPPAVRLVEMPDPEPYADQDPAAWRRASTSAPAAGYARTGRGRPLLWIALAAILLAGAGSWYWLSGSDARIGPRAESSAAPAAAVEEEAGEAPREPVATDAAGTVPEDATAGGEDTGEAAAAGPVDPAASPGAKATANLAPTDVEPPAPAPTALAPAEPAPTNPPTAPARRVSRITWEESNGVTEVVIWGDGSFDDDSYRRYRLEGASPREVVRLLGIGEPVEPGVIEVGTREVRRVRTGLHLETDPDELHVVIDLVGPAVVPAGIRAEGSQLRLRLETR